MVRNQSKFHVPSVRARFVNRAKFLQEHRPFLQALDKGLEDWNQRFPMFAVHHRGIPPEQPPWGIPNDYIYSKAMSEAIDKYNEHLHTHTFPTIEDKALDEAMIAWRELIDEICHKWWPVRYYPSWIGINDHPAQLFVSACLLWKPQLLSIA